MEELTHHRRLSDQDIIDQEFTDRDTRLIVWHGVARMARHVMRMANVAAGVSIALERLWVREAVKDEGYTPFYAMRDMLRANDQEGGPRGYTLL